ncbi:serine hydrolase domain-containing protein [Actinocrispum wychmicini]|uniref:CubicO group peptidase (Beta-lactamase class C family) n=1 Tax=Actinocrispum wychmicini TaxID=1213861 RepID=A0A4R2JKD5_9PSEU|nr:serine hydrolase domain-containing protein [Actinocrispum wychmicini]TCO59614.1 CubicO group peptidase (beta-lactamase class C family) [Actinocrispum wychmicini]
MTELQETVRELVARSGVPGAVVGVLEDGRVETAAAGVANLNSGVEMTPDTLFLTGSITKVWTTTLLMSLVEQDLVDLDSPVRRYLPDLVLRDPGVADALLVRHLVTHSTGIDASDLIADVGDGDAAIANWVPLLRDVGQLFAPGEYFSYNNAGFVLAGRIIEVVTGESFATAMRHRVFAPLGLERSMFTAKEAILHRTAIGHSPGEGGMVPSKLFMLPECLGPAGTTLITSVQDTLTFVASHLPTHPAAKRLLNPESVDRMAAHHLDFPVPETGSVGLSWLRKQYGDRVALTHGGGSYGGVAMVGALPDSGTAYIAYANGGAASMPFHQDLAEALWHDRFGLSTLDAPDVSGPAPAPSRYHGRYVCWGCELVITDDGDALSYQARFTDPVLGRNRSDPPPVRLRPVGEHGLAMADHPNQPPFGYSVGDDGTGHPEFLFLMDRLVRRVGDS